MHDAHGVRAGHAQTGIAHAAAKVQVLAMQEIAFVESADRIEHRARQQHRGAGNDVHRLHVRRIERYAQSLARAAGLSITDSTEIGYSSILHDVGKLHTPDLILKKPGPLTPDERRTMETHTVTGERIISQDAFFATARAIARHHHENWDGSGYPDRLAKDAIPLPARIVHLVDVYDALTSTRPYKISWTPQRALESIRTSAGTMFDPDLVETFLKLSPEHLTT